MGLALTTLETNALCVHLETTTSTIPFNRLNLRIGVFHVTWVHTHHIGDPRIVKFVHLGHLIRRKVLRIASYAKLIRLMRTGVSHNANNVKMAVIII